MTDATFVFYPVFEGSEEIREMDADDIHDASREVEALLKDWAGRVDIRGSYSTVAFRPDAELMLWLLGSSADDMQRFLVEFRRTDVGRLLELSWTFMGVVRPGEVTVDHAPAFARGEAPRRYLCVYPFVRTPQWYLLPSEERVGLLAEHGEFGREFPDVLANTTSGFGLGDWEWILAFETDRLETLVDCIRRLRDANARLYTKEEVPFLTGIRKPVGEALADLV
jgi:chlorite dismutase